MTRRSPRRWGWVPAFQLYGGVPIREMRHGNLGPTLAQIARQGKIHHKPEPIQDMARRGKLKGPTRACPGYEEHPPPKHDHGIDNPNRIGVLVFYCCTEARRFDMFDDFYQTLLNHFRSGSGSGR